MNEISDLLERIETPPLDVEADVDRGQSALRRRHRLQVSGAALSLAAIAAIGASVQGASWNSGASDRSYLHGTQAPARPQSSTGSWRPIHRPPDESDQAVREQQHVFTDWKTQQTMQHYRDVIATHLGPDGDELRLAENEGGGSGSFDTEMDWRHGGMLEIVVGTRWDAADGSYTLADVGMRPTTYDGRPARVSTTGDDLVVSVRHVGGTVVTLIASRTFGNNHTSTPSLGLTQSQLLAAAADQRLKLPYYLR